MATRDLPEMPNGPILELYGQRKRFHVPHGLKILLEEVTKEILRFQPEDIYLFMAEYFYAKLEKRPSHEHRRSWREWTLEEPSIVPLEELQELLDELGLTKDQADAYAQKIQARFRGFQTRRSLEYEGKVVHKDHRKSWEWMRWAWEGNSVLDASLLAEFLNDIQMSYEDANKFAIKIQNAYRGFKARKSSDTRKSKDATVKSEVEESEQTAGKTTGSEESKKQLKSDNVGDNEGKSSGGATEAEKAAPKSTAEILKELNATEEEATEAALKIQTAFRSFKARKKGSADA